MSSTVAAAGVLQDVERHPASVAWHVVVGDGRRPTAIEPLKLEREKSAVYRLTLPDPGNPSVIAKRRPQGELEAEARIHAELLPEVGVSTLELYGHLTGWDGFDWLFLEDAGETRYSRETAEHQSLAVEWLGRLHAGAAPGPSWLPETGPDYFRSVLDLARDGLRRGLAHRAVSAAGKEVLSAIGRSLETVEERWHQVAETCARFPRTLVHGDFVPKNVRVREQDGLLGLVAFDWETAGTAPPAVDIAHLCTSVADRRRYLAIVNDVWPELRMRDVRELAAVGELFWLLHVISWAGRSFKYEWVEQAMRDMIEYERRLHVALADDRWHRA